MTQPDDRIAKHLQSQPWSLSGQQIADLLGIDTVAAWAALERLEAQGRVVQHAPGWWRTSE